MSCASENEPPEPTRLHRSDPLKGWADQRSCPPGNKSEQPKCATKMYRKGGDARSRAKEKASGGGASKKGAKAPPARTAGAAPIPTARLVPAHLLRRGTTPCARGGGRRARIALEMSFPAHVDAGEPFRATKIAGNGTPVKSTSNAGKVYGGSLDVIV